MTNQGDDASTRVPRATAQGQTIWSGRATGRTHTPPPVDSASLLASARRHAMRGMRARSAGDGEHDDAALQLGTMLEHLAKAYLASLHPTLILEDRFDLFSTLQQVGLGHRGKPGHVLKTVGIYEALTRIGIIQSPSTPGAGKAFAARFERVLQARNGVAHAGQDGG